MVLESWDERIFRRLNPDMVQRPHVLSVRIGSQSLILLYTMSLRGELALKVLLLLN